MKPDRLLSLLLAGIGLLGILPLLPFLDGPLRLLALVALPLGVWLRHRRQFLPNLPATLVTLAGTVFYLLQLSLADPVRPLVHALVLLLCLRQLTEPTPRHLLQGYVLSLVLLSGSSLLSLSPWFLLLLVLQITAISLALVLLTFYARQADLRLTAAHARALWRTALWLPLGSLVLMGFFFFILPRTQTPLWDLFNPAPRAQTGYSDEVRPGAATAVESSQEVVLRAEMAAIPTEDLYWRGAVLDRFDGQVWRRPQRPRPPEQVTGGRPLQIQLVQRAGRAPVLLTLDRPERWIEGRVRPLGGRVFTASQRGNRQQTYRLQSRLDGRLLPGGSDRSVDLALPENLSPRLQQLATELGEGTPAERVAQTLDWYRQQGFRYSTEQLPTGEGSLERFLFDAQAGHCEFFAASLAVLLRLQGVPARLVGGYYGGEYNPLGGYYLVREAMAHVWVEALLPDEGWRRLDPSGLAANAATGIAGRRSLGLPWHQRLADGLGYLWTRTVITYDLKQQIRTAGQLRQQLSGVRQWGVPVAAIMTVAAVAVWWARRRRPAGRRRWQREQRLWHALLKRLDLDETDLSPMEGLQHLAHSSNDPALQRFIALYQQALYDATGLTDARYHQLHRLLQSINSGAKKR